MTQILYIDTDEGLVDYCALINKAEFVAVDTEFLRETTYYPRLCLIQLHAMGKTACIDPLRVRNFSPMLAIFHNPDVTKVLHSARQDMEVFLHAFDSLPAPVYDTQIAASLTGLGDQISYANLVNEMLQVQLDKSHSRTDWSCRPLDDAQISYAADDVRYLAKLYPLQRQRLESQGRLTWLQDDFNAMTEASCYRPDPANLWRKVKRHTRLQGVDLMILKKMAEYREKQAMEQDRPRRFILSDDQLLDLVRGKPKATKDMERYRSLNRKIINQYGSALLECIQVALSIPREKWPEVNRSEPLMDSQEVVVDILMGLLKQQAKKNAVSMALMASRKEVEKLVCGKRDIALMSGWRYELGGKVLAGFLDGKLKLGVQSRQLVLS